jgi:hypothetical protein
MLLSLITKDDLSYSVDEPSASFTVRTAEAALKTWALQQLDDQAGSAATTTERRFLIPRKAITAATTVSQRS